MKYKPWDWQIPGFRPRDWQAECIDPIFEALDVGGAPVVSVVMGGGKSIEIGEACARYPGPVIVATPKQRLVHELSETLTLRLGYVGQWYGRNKTQARVIVACHASLSTVPIRPGTLLIVDECHKTENNRFKAGVERLREGDPGLKFLGFTATPYGANAKGRLSLFDRTVYELTPGRALGMGIVVPWEIVSNTDQDLPINEAAVLACQHAPYPCVVDAVSIEDAEEFAEVLEGHGLSCGVIHSKQSFRAQDETIRALVDGQIKVLIQIELLTEGVNIKEIRSLVLRRTRSSRTSFAQFIGRGLRVAPGKDKCIIYDLPGNFERLRLSYTAALGEGEQEEPEYISPINTVAPAEERPPDRARKSKVMTKLSAYLRRLTVGVYELGKERPNDGHLIRNMRVTPRQLSAIGSLFKGLALSGAPFEHMEALCALRDESEAMTRGEAADLIVVLREVGLYGWPDNLELLATLPRGGYR